MAVRIYCTAADNFQHTQNPVCSTRLEWNGVVDDVRAAVLSHPAEGLSCNIGKCCVRILSDVALVGLMSLLRDTGCRPPVKVCRSMTSERVPAWTVFVFAQGR